ncbi:MAG: hypothetical protein ACREQZ_08925 [Woeseiaceae bacterium]
MTLVSISGATAIAFISTLLFLLMARGWHALSRSFAGATRFSHSIMAEAAQRFRDRLDALSRRLSLYLASALVFAVIFLTAYLLRPEQLFGGVPDWQLISMLVIAACALAWGCYRFLRLLVEKQRIAFLCDASMATGHGLQKLSASQNRVFHDVPTAAGVIDNVVVGQHGVHTVCVVAKKPGKHNKVRLMGDQLAFAPGNHVVSVAECGKRSSQLAREIRKAVGHAIRVRPVIAVPGWEIDAQASEEYLVVNERNLAMLRGWKDSTDHLMNEDVERVQEMLTERCRRYRRS